MPSREGVTPGFGRQGLERRLAAIERVLMGLRPEKIYTTRPTGTGVAHTVLAAYAGGFDSDNMRLPPPFFPFISLATALADGIPVWKVRLHPGYVFERNPKAGDYEEAVIKWRPRTQGADFKYLDDEEPPLFDLKSGETLCVTYETDDHGKITNDPWPYLEVTDDWLGGTHYQPVNPDEDEGVKGQYRVPIVLIEGTAEEWTETIYQQSDIEHYAELFTGVNIGSGARVFKKRNRENDTYEYRSLLETGQVQVNENPDDIEIRGNEVDGGLTWKDDGESTPGENDKINWEDGLNADSGNEIILPVVKAGGAQIQVTKNKNPGDVRVYHVEGNGAGGTLLFENCSGAPLFELTWEDGLITNIVGATIRAGCPESSPSP